MDTGRISGRPDATSSGSVSHGSSISVSMGSSGRVMTDEVAWMSALEYFEQLYSPFPLDEALKEAPEGYAEAVLRLPRRSNYQPWELERIDERNLEYQYTEHGGKKKFYEMARRAALPILGGVSWLAMNGINQTHTFGLEKLHDLVQRRPPHVGLLTLSNHKSVIDDPFLVMGVLTPRSLPVTRPQDVRWGTCAADICFRTPFNRFLMALGKVLPVHRRGGLNQPEIRDIADQLGRGEWVHYFPEGRIEQNDEIDLIRRGTGKLIAEAAKANHGILPLVVPIFHQGTEQMMPHNEENRLNQTFPKKGNNVFVIVGDPIDMKDLFEKYQACFMPVKNMSDSDCVPLFEEISDRIALTLRLLRADLRLRVMKDGIDLGDAFRVE